MSQHCIFQQISFKFCGTIEKKKNKKSGFKSLPLIIKGKIQWIEVTFKYTLLFFQIKGEQILRDKFLKKLP